MTGDRWRNSLIFALRVLVDRFFSSRRPISMFSAKVKEPVESAHVAKSEQDKILTPGHRGRFSVPPLDRRLDEQTSSE